MKYDWILFDADETLFHFDAYAGLQRMFSRFDVAFAESDYEHFQALNKPLWEDYHNARISADYLQQQRFASWADRLGVSAQRLNGEFLDAMGEICRPLAGARELIEGLHGKVGLALITNGFTRLQTMRLERTGMRQYFSAVIISEQVGYAKPDPAIFEHAFALMSHPPRPRVLMVGDNPLTDIKGGLDVGIDTCWVNPRGEDKPHGIEPHYQVRSLQELHRILLEQ